MDSYQKFGVQFSSKDPYQKFGLVYNPDDDTLARLNALPSITTEAHNAVPNQPIFTRDIPLNATHKTGIRLYTPINPKPTTKLPLIFFIRPGGFVFGSNSENTIHDICNSLAIHLSAVILSLEHREAPENRLPAAYEDGMEALLWIQNEALKGSTLNGIVDFSNCYLMGSSAGGNIIYNMGLRMSSMDLKPLVIRGYIFDHPAFSSLERSASELRLADDPFLGLADSDMFWQLALPRGSNRDHEYCNPMVAAMSYKDKIGTFGRCLVSTRGGDLLVDNQLRFANMLEAYGVQVVLRFMEQGHHCMDMAELSSGKGVEYATALKEFISY